MPTPAKQLPAPAFPCIQICNDRVSSLLYFISCPELLIACIFHFALTHGTGLHIRSRCLSAVNKHSTGEVSLHISISILETSQWNDLHAIRTGIGHLAACDYNHQIWLTKRYLFFHLVVFTDKAFNLYKMGCSILYLTAA